MEESHLVVFPHQLILVHEGPLIINLTMLLHSKVHTLTTQAILKGL